MHGGCCRRSRPLLMAAALLALACADRGGRGGPPVRDVPLIGLQRGGHWSVLTIRPPHLNGQQFHMVLKNSVLTGAVSGGAAPAGTLRVNIAKDGAQGFGPLGPVSLDYFVDEASTTVEGTWNGGRVHLVFAKDSIKGTVASNSFFFSKSNASGLSGTDAFRSPRLRGRSADMIEPLPSDVSCEYYLDSVTPDGALNGGSTCAGMPQQTRLEVPSMARAWMTHAELVTVLVAVLSSPPIVLAEDYGPRFEQPSTGSFPTSPPRGR
jgi:hypothetical protein